MKLALLTIGPVVSADVRQTNKNAAINNANYYSRTNSSSQKR